MQAKLKVGPADDEYEREADEVADQVMRTADPAVRGEEVDEAVPQIQHSVQRKISGGPCQSTNAPTVVSDVLRSPGIPLDSSTRQFMEARFQRDFGGVRMHTDSQAMEAARATSALAFTVGSDVVVDAGKYSPGTSEGRRLIAHELTHTVQQGAVSGLVQRVCDPAVLAGRSAPVFFPHESTILDVFSGAATLTRSMVPRVSLGLIQQALVDLGIDLGTSGPHGDGVDRKFGSDTETGVAAFQSAESIPGVASGVVDEPTLKCLDEKRSQLPVPPHQTATVSPSQVRVAGQETGGRDEDIFFDRGNSTLDAADKTKIGRLLTRATNPLKGCSLTLEGFISEDELVEFGANLATDRIDAVDAEFAARGHDDPGSACPNPSPPLRAHSPLPTASSGVSDYRSRRKVEVVPPGNTSTTAPCPPGSPIHRTLTGPENTVLKDAIDMAVGWMDTAIGELTPGDAEGDAALTAYFGNTSRRSTIKANLVTWRGHLDRVVRTNNRHGTQCNATCRTAIAFNNGSGASAQMTVCPRFFQTMSFHPALTQDEKKAFVMMHEAGHGSIRTRDTGYGHKRLIEFLAGFPAIAENNTDSYTLMVLCLEGFAGFCAAPATTDTPVGLSGPEEVKSRRGLAWLQTWLTWTEQDTSSLYGRMNIARETGQGLRAVNTYYAGVYDDFVAEFNVRRPPGDPPPTFLEQTRVSASLDRILPMVRATAAGLTVEKDNATRARWAFGPGRNLFLKDAYFVLTTDRQRVEHLLPLIITANAQISSALEPVYERYIKRNVKNQRNDKP